MTWGVTGVYWAASTTGTVVVMQTMTARPPSRRLLRKLLRERGGRTLLRQRGSAATLVAPLAAAALALALGTVVPLLGPLLIALIIGVVVVNSRLGSHPAIAGHGATRFLLRLGVAALGLRLPFADIVSIGPSGLVVIAATVLATFTGTQYVGRRLGLEDGLVMLIATGFSICGAAAIAAVEDTVRARQQHVALAVAMVTIYGSAMMVAVPWLAGVIGLSDGQAAIWAGASIHEVAQVAAAGSLIGTSAVALAMTVKLGRVALLAPLSVVLARTTPGAKGATAPLVPWFIVAFVGAVAVRTSGLLPQGVLSVTDVLTTLLLAAGMYGLGMGIRARDLWPLPVQVLTLATISTLIAAGTSLALVLSLT
ncbi:YeiH family protein [Janibacter indicus]|uniref:Conserved hypothetical integral membrane protein n=1 Tax=Janibacter indicus TaxID=857417 RepID=A0A1W2A6Y1_9MICO|nr:putative sulfate exporter family transporter [Janibacter indicus]SMC56434.1 conserved hypothetical integral membrane protein [Janibacter indicus]